MNQTTHPDADPALAQLATGVDIVHIPRIAKLIDEPGQHSPGQHSPGQHFLDKVFTTAEQATCAGNPERLAARWAAKEATIKALGLHIADIDLRDIEVISAEGAPPRLALHGSADEAAKRLGPGVISLSLAHDGDYAIAFVVSTSSTRAIKPR
ncbi:MAG: holo-ACP synthase [Candidatus Nanopelagicales bacterium]|nr:holo-ACP synthase [Candidatus Nanopelagicales bacterium]MDZ4249817.1 holo-ACP synthase [Candidatus Nanopelagicales bacterium]